MALSFPNLSRHFDEVMHADEAGMLEAFDAHRDLIYAAAVRLHGRGRNGAYDLLPSDV